MTLQVAIRIALDYLACLQSFEGGAMSSLFEP